MYMVMGFSGLSDSSQSSCVTMEMESESSMAPERQTMRSWRSLEKMSSAGSVSGSEPGS
jgi:hypothetical protein